eukprot:1178146-Prorocentrum_minimum.AAC.1
MLIISVTQAGRCVLLHKCHGGADISVTQGGRWSCAAASSTKCAGRLPATSGWGGSSKRSSPLRACR